MATALPKSHIGGYYVPVPLGTPGASYDPDIGWHTPLSEYVGRKHSLPLYHKDIKNYIPVPYGTTGASFYPDIGYYIPADEYRRLTAKLNVSAPSFYPEIPKKPETPEEKALREIAESVGESALREPGSGKRLRRQSHTRNKKHRKSLKKHKRSKRKTHRRRPGHRR